MSTVSNAPKKPDFIYIGAGKCGTTSLHQYLDQHPNVYICPQKETYFFLPEQVRKNLRRYGAILTEEDYLKLFQDAPPNSCIVEFSTTYYAHGDSAKLIADALPKVKLLATLRNPVDRAFSSYQMLVRAGGEKRPFKDLLDPDIKYVKRGFYYSELLPFFDRWHKQDLKVLLYEDLCSNPKQFMQEIFAFLGVEQSFMPDMSKRGRTGGLPKNQAFHRLLTKENTVRKLAASLLRPLLPKEKRQQLRDALVKQNITKVELDAESRARLTLMYRDDILKLQDLIDRDLSAWLETPHTQ